MVFLLDIKSLILCKLKSFFKTLAGINLNMPWFYPVITYLFSITKLGLNHCILYSTSAGLLTNSISNHGFHPRLIKFKPFGLMRENK